MALFYSRTEFQHETVIKYAAWPYVITLVLLPVFVLTLAFQHQLGLPQYAVDIVFFIFIGTTLARMLGQWSINKEIRLAMKEGKVTMTGARFSPSNPVTVTIKKS